MLANDSRFDDTLLFYGFDDTLLAGSPCFARESAASAELIAGRYRLEKLLGRGGIGEVFEATDLRERTKVAVKRLYPDTSTTDDVARLAMEARLEIELVHPNIVRALDFGRSPDGGAYLVMERLVGQSLGERLQKGPRMPAIEAVRTLLPVVEAMAFAHARGVFHLDLKPDNIFIARERGRSCPKLIDFGIASCGDQAVDASLRGKVSGSPGYMSPEQAHGFSDLDHRADVWALCVVLYEMLSGQFAFSGPSCYATLLAVVESQVPPLCGASSDAASLHPIVQRGLEKDRARRFQSTEELGSALAGWLLARGCTEDLCGTNLGARWRLETASSHHAIERPLARQRRQICYGLTLG